MKSSVIFALLTMLPLFSIQAQELSADDAMNEINRIKLDGNYVWAEGTSTKSKKEAIENAQSVLSYEIQNWLSVTGQKDVKGVILPTSDQYMKIHTQRRSLHRVFVYVDKNQIVPYNKDKTIVVMEKKEEKKKKSEEPKIKSSYEEVYIPTHLEQEMLNIKITSEIAEYIRQPKIESTGTFKDRPQTGEYYIFIYNREGKVPACLKFNNGILTNVATGKEDSFDNYKGCGGRWFILKK